MTRRKVVVAGINLRLNANERKASPSQSFVPWRQNMKKTLLITGVLLALAASTAMAGGVNLAWTDCGLNGQPTRAFACASNAGSNVLCVSYDPNVVMTNMVGNDIRVDLQSADATTLNNWWQMFNSGSCRAASISTNVVFGAATCADFWSAGGAGGIGSYTVSGNKASLLMFWAVTTPGQVDPGTEYYSINVAINNAKTVGTGACTGCQTGVCLVANVVQLDGDSNNLQKIENPRDANFVTWQGGAVVGGCPAAVPTQSRTWGQVKSLYR